MATLADAQQSALDTRSGDDWRVVLLTLCEAIVATRGFPDGVTAACEQVRTLPPETLEEQVDLLLGNAIEGVDRAGGAPSSWPHYRSVKHGRCAP